MMRKLLSLFPLLLLLLASGPAEAQFTPDTIDYAWPTDASPYLSGTFGETRSQHFHAALDIKTWGRRGYNVFATRDGTLHRIAIGPGGYGKALYLKHEDGSYSLYAHLLSFEDRIQHLADSLRIAADYSGQIDRVVDSLGINIQRGEQIGYTGATGIGPPHLHFELRTPSEKPFNPLLTNLRIPDGVPPRFKGLAVEPLSPESMIEGRRELYRRRAARSEGSYDFGTISVSGPVGLAIDIYDQADNVYNAYAVYDLKMKLDQQLLFHSRVDSFSYDETGMMFLDRIYPLLRDRGLAYQRLHVVNGNTLPFYRETVNRGRLDLPPGRHTIRIIASDYFGNRSEARVTLQVNTREPQRQVSASGTNGHGSNGQSDPQTTWKWHSSWIDFNGSDSHTHTVIALDRDRRTWARPAKVNAGGHLLLNRSDLLAIAPAAGNPDSEPIHLYRMIPGQTGRAYSTPFRAYATFRPNSLYDTLQVNLTSRYHRTDSVEVTLLPDTKPLRGEIELSYLLRPSQMADSTLSFYEYDRRKDRLSYIPTRRGGPVLKGDNDRMGTYFILSDNRGPELSDPRIYRRRDGRWVGQVTAEDARSGIDPKTARFYINGVRGLAEFEPEDNRILYYHPDFGPQSEYTLRIEVSDMIGNRTERTFRIR